MSDNPKVVYLQRESLVSGFALLVSATSQRSNQGLQGRAKPPAVRSVETAGVSEALWMCVQAFLVPQLKTDSLLNLATSLNRTNLPDLRGDLLTLQAASIVLQSAPLLGSQLKTCTMNRSCAVCMMKAHCFTLRPIPRNDK